MSHVKGAIFYFFKDSADIFAQDTITYQNGPAEEAGQNHQR